MALPSYRRHRFPPPIIQHAIRLYLRFTLSYRDVEELLAERGLDVSYETVGRWVLKFGPSIARDVSDCSLRHEQQHDTADRASDAGDQLGTYIFLAQEHAAQQQGHQRVAGDDRGDDRNRPIFEGSVHRQDRKTIA